MEGAERTARITIGIPVYNSSATISEAIDGIVAQTRTDWRLVVADNASTDGTAEVVAERAAADPRISLIRQPRNLGQAANFRTVFEAGETELFMWLSGDDRLRADYLALCVAELDRDPSLIGVFTDAEGIDADGRSMGRFLERSGVDRDHPDRPRRFSAAVHATVGFAMFGLYRTEALARSPLLEPYVGSDRVLAGALALIGPIRELPDVAFLRRVHAEQYSRAANTNRHRYRSYTGREAPRLRPLWTTRITRLAGLVWGSGGPLGERLTMERTVFGSFLWRILKGELMMLVRTGATVAGRITGRRIDVMDWMMRRGEVFDSAR
ncbi:MAG: glycosyltransferase family 2 protein [Actinomycetota bacterium]